MNIDDLDIGILAYLSDNSQCTTTELSKKLFEPKDNRELVKIDANIRYRLKRLVESGVVTNINTKPAYYDLNKSKVFFGFGDLKVNLENNKHVSLDFGYFMVIRDGLDDVIVKSMDAYEERLKQKGSIIK